MKRERFSMSRILSVLSIVVALMAIPSIGYTMTYNQGFVDGQEQVSQLQTEISILSTRMGEMEADLFLVTAEFSVESSDSETVEVSSLRPKNNGLNDCHIDHECHVNPEVGWRGIF